MRTLIVYFSFTGNNELLAHELQTRLACDIFRIEELKKRSGFTILMDLLFKRHPKIQLPETPLEIYSHLILIAPVWDANVAAPMKTFIATEKARIVSYSFITVCSGREGQTEKLNRQLTELAGKAPLSVTQLCINDLLPPEKKNNIKYTTPYRIGPKDLAAFKESIDSYLTIIPR